MRTGHDEWHAYAFRPASGRDIGVTSTQPGTVFITGASSGFGAAIAHRFATAGARVVAAARRSDRLKDLAAELGPRVLPVTLDVRDRAAVARVTGGLPAEFAQIDVLVNNAGAALGLSPAQDADLDDWEQMIDTNCKGLAYCTRAILPGMVARRRGHVINLGSVAGTYPYPGGNAYGGTKAFVHQFSLNLRSDLHGTGVTSGEPAAGATRNAPDFEETGIDSAAGRQASPAGHSLPLGAPLSLGRGQRLAGVCGQPASGRRGRRGAWRVGHRVYGSQER
jgi:3-hydroxy acid dehydrogenase/malonic semialdehyde reductase